MDPFALRAKLYTGLDQLWSSAGKPTLESYFKGTGVTVFYDASALGLIWWSWCISYIKKDAMDWYTESKGSRNLLEDIFSIPCTVWHTSFVIFKRWNTFVTSSSSLCYVSLVSFVYVVQYVPAQDMPNITIYKLLLRRFQEYQGSYCISR